jgi:transcriptional regulator NrdR family protein
MAETITCTHCLKGRPTVADSRCVDNIVRRRRKCPSCGFRTTTYEIPSEVFDTTALGRLGRKARDFTPDTPTTEGEKTNEA